MFRILRALILSAALIGTIPFSAIAASDADIDTLVDAMRTNDLIDIMRDEGLEHATELEGDLFPGRGRAAWPRIIKQIYDADQMAATYRADFAAAMGDTDTAALIDFFTSDLGQRIIELEISGRRALMAPDVEEAAKEAYADMRARQDPRLEALERFAEINDLVEMNVMGGMNASYAFYQGLATGQNFNLTEEQILTDVWEQEDVIRADTEEWVFGYLAMAYEPLSDADIEAYTVLSESSEGRVLNQAIFAGFDRLFNNISRDLGKAAAQFLAGEDI